MTMSPATDRSPDVEVEPVPRETRLRQATWQALEIYKLAYRDDPEQASEMTVRAALDTLDELKPSRASRGRPGGSNLRAFSVGVDPASLFRSVAWSDWMPLEGRDRERFISIVQQESAIA